MDIFDDIASDKPEGDVLTLEMLASMIERLRNGSGTFGHPIMPTAAWSTPWRSDPFPGLRTFLSDYIPAETPRRLTRWERFRVWVEDLADRADVYYHYPRVQRTEPPKALLIGRDLYIPRAAAAVLAEFVRARGALRGSS